MTMFEGSTRFTSLLLASLFALAITPVAAVSASAADESTLASVTGRVLDPLGGSIPNATVHLVREGQSVSEATTDEDGWFALAYAASGRYRVRAEAQGFESRETDPVFVGVGGRVAIDVTLAIGPLAQQVVVSAEATELPESQVGASVTVLDRQAIDDSGKADVLELLRLVPGVQVLQTGQRGGTASLFVRGGNANFNKIIIDGVSANDIGSGGGFDLASLPVTGIERVEVLRNPNSVLYGADALAGVVNITTRRGSSRLPELSYAVDGGNLGTLRQDLSLAGARGRADYFSEFSHFDTDNNVPNDAYHNGTYAGTFGWTLSPTARLTVTGRRTATAQGVPNAFDYFQIADDSSQTNRDTYVGATLRTQTTSRWQQTVRVTSTDLQFHFLNPSLTGEPVDVPGLGLSGIGRTVTIHGGNGTTATGRAVLDFGPPPPYPQFFDSSTSRRMVSGQTDYSVSRDVSLSAGARFEDESGDTDFSGSRTTTTRHNGGAFVEGRESLGGRVYVSEGVGLDHNTAFGFAATPRVSMASYLRRPSSRGAVGGTKLLVNFGRGIKAPSISQQARSLFAFLSAAPQGAGLISRFGIDPIGPERSRDLDAGVEQGLWAERGRVRATLFDNRYTNLIEFVSKGALVPLGVPRDVIAAIPGGPAVNSSSYRARGFELAFDGRIGAHILAGGQYTYLDAVVTQSFATSALRPAINPAYPGVPIGAFAPLVGGRPFRRAPNTASLHASFYGPRGQLSIAGYFVGHQDASTFQQPDALGGNSLLLPNHDLAPAYQKIDVSGDYRLERRLRVYAVVENILNEKYEAALGFPSLPITVRAGIALSVGGARLAPE
jgi:vitamin B12 transporter